MGILQKLLGSTSGNVAEVDANNQLNISPTTTKSRAGFVALGGRNDDGTVTGTPRVNRIYATEGNSLKTSEAELLWDDTFNATAQNTAKYNFAATTQTGSQAGGFLILNTSAITTINTNSGIQTFRTFPLFAKSELRCTISALMTTVPQSNNLIELGLFAAVLTTRVAPTDGVFFRYNASAELRGVINYAGVETTTAAITAPSASVNHDYTIVLQTNTVVFYIDDIVVGALTLLTDAPSQGQPMAAATVPICIRTYIGGSAPASATQVKVSDVFVTALGPDMSRLWSEQKAGFGHMLSQGQNGGTMGSTALYTNSLAPGAGAAMTNTTAALGTGLGGQFAAQPTLAANTDGIMQSFQNPAGSVTQTPRNIILLGITIQGMVTTLIAGGPILYFYSLAYGHTAVSMATAEAASFTAGGTTKAPRRIPLGVETFPVSAPLGALGQGVSVRFIAPIVIAPGEFLAICAKNVGTVSSAGVVTFLVAFDGYEE